MSKEKIKRFLLSGR